MTIWNLDALFGPKSIALVGASSQPGSIGTTLARILLNGGFKGLGLAGNLPLVTGRTAD